MDFWFNIFSFTISGLSGRVRGGGGGGGEEWTHQSISNLCNNSVPQMAIFLTEFRYLIFFSEIKGHLTIKKSSPFSYTSAYQT